MIGGCEHGCRVDDAQAKAAFEARRIYEPLLPLGAIIEGVLGMLVGAIIAACVVTIGIARKIISHFRREVSSPH